MAKSISRTVNVYAEERLGTANNVHRFDMQTIHVGPRMWQQAASAVIKNTSYLGWRINMIRITECKS